MWSLIKFVVFLVVLAGLAALFLRTARESGAEAYTVPSDRLTGWTLVAAGEDPRRPVVALRPPVELSADLFRQVFRRTMTSLSTPALPEVPLVVASDFTGGRVDEALAERVVAAARDAGLERATPQARCLARHRVSEPGETLEFYYLVLDVPEFGPFRDEVARLVESMGGGIRFDPRALGPVLLVAASERGLLGPLPFRPDPERDCLASVVVE
jgi:hypothetical protein